MLRFVTASERDIARFEILRSESPTGEFDRIASLESHGNSSGTQTYECVDTQVIPGHTYWYYVADVSLDGARDEHLDLIQSVSVTATPVPSDYSLTAYRIRSIRLQLSHLRCAKQVKLN